MCHCSLLIATLLFKSIFDPRVSSFAFGMSLIAFLMCSPFRHIETIPALFARVAALVYTCVLVPWESVSM